MNASLLIEIAEFFASRPSLEQILEFRPSKEVQQRATELLAKQQERGLAEGEVRELDEFMVMESLMRLVKARSRLAGRKKAGS